MAHLDVCCFRLRQKSFLMWNSIVFWALFIHKDLSLCFTFKTKGRQKVSSRDEKKDLTERDVNPKSRSIVLCSAKYLDQGWYLQSMISPWRKTTEISSPSAITNLPMFWENKLLCLSYPVTLRVGVLCCLLQNGRNLHESTATPVLL